MSDEAVQDTGAPIPPPLESPSPETARDAFKEELEAAVEELGGSKPRNGHKVKEKEPEPPKQEPKPEGKEPVTQERLSSGFAKLERQRKSVAKKEAELAAKEADLTARLAAFDKDTSERGSALETRGKELDELFKLLDTDEEAFLEAVAARRKTTSAEFYDKLTRRRLNGGVRAPEDQVAEVRSELEALKREKADKEAAEKEAAEKAKQEQEQLAAQKAFEQRIHRENSEFVDFCKSKDDTDKTRYPLLSDETPEDIVNTARQLIAGAVAQGKNVGYKDVADYMEHLLSLQKLKEEAEAARAAKVEAETPKKSAPKAEGKKAESAKAKTLTNSASAPRVLKSEGTPQNDGERLDLALQTWDKLAATRSK